jgi:hypothetical protein
MVLTAKSVTSQDKRPKSSAKVLENAIDLSIQAITSVEPRLLEILRSFATYATKVRDLTTLGTPTTLFPAILTRHLLRHTNPATNLAVINH